MSLNWKAGIVALSLFLSVYAGAYAFDMDRYVQRTTEQENQMYSIALGMSSEEAAAVLQENKDGWEVFLQKDGMNLVTLTGKDISVGLSYEIKNGKVNSVSVSCIGNNKKQIQQIYEAIKNIYSKKYGDPISRDKGKEGVPMLVWKSSNKLMLRFLSVNKDQKSNKYNLSFTLYDIISLRDSIDSTKHSQQPKSVSNSVDSIPTFTV